MKVYVQPCVKTNVANRPLKRKVRKIAEKVNKPLVKHRAAKNVMKRTKELDMMFLRVNPDIAAKVAATKVFLQQAVVPKPEILFNDEKYNLKFLVDLKFEDAVKDERSPRKAYNLLGAYGLMAYTHSMLDTEDEAKMLPEINNHKVNEAFYDDSEMPINHVFNKYLSLNNNGYTDEIYQRFGQVGKDLADYYSMNNFILKGADESFNETYRTTEAFKELFLDVLPVEDAVYRLFPDKNAKVL